ncbi:protein of unknown function [Blastococcus saxobsidens DD2]|uniref:Uncharacterized protein n=1 Tax=Blastococcus saxobsidens (strain DD2) TaxID=1146883 RepID=H6RJ30_BLASD|nr:protein of unknown function [Blastococcus saxobsidens DD2]
MIARRANISDRPYSDSDTAQWTRLGIPAGVLHGAAALSLVLGLGAGWWLAFALPA